MIISAQIVSVKTWPGGLRKEVVRVTLKNQMVKMMQMQHTFTFPPFFPCNHDTNKANVSKQLDIVISEYHLVLM